MKRRSSRFGLAGFFSKSRANVRQEESVGTVKEENEDGNDFSYVPAYIPISGELDAFPQGERSTILLQPKPSRSALRAKKSPKIETVATRSTTWDPPPLFQAYPQAIKHATLRVPCLSAEAIVRLHANRNNSQISGLSSSDLRSTQPQKEKRLARHTVAEVLTKGEWTDRIFILVTSGYIIQYAGTGSCDRLPEKIMPLTMESAAFASDAIPGQPYVLQISQVSDDQGTLDKDASRSMLKKLGLRNEMRRSTSAFLLVLENPDEMSGWLSAVRREIQAMGGKEYKQDEFCTRNSTPILQHRPSQRYLVGRDPNQFSDRPAGNTMPKSRVVERPQSEGDDAKNRVGGGVMPENRLMESPTNQAQVKTLPENWLVEPSINKRQSLATQSSVISQSASNTTSSINQTYLDQLRESPRESYAAAEVNTVSTSRESSLRLSLDGSNSEVPDLTRAFAENRAKPSAYVGAVHKPGPNRPKADAFYPKTLRPASSAPLPLYPEFAMPKNGRTPSPAAPNFSTPTFSKRYSTVNGPPSSSCTAENPQSPSLPLPRPPSPPRTEGGTFMTETPLAVASELQYLGRPNVSTLRKNSFLEKEASLTPPQSSGSCGYAPSHDGDKRFSRRLSSLEYSRGVSPIQIARQSPSPHPPPTAALPALPAGAPGHRASLYAPPTAALPPIPSASKLPQRFSMMPPTTGIVQSTPDNYLRGKSAATSTSKENLHAHSEGGLPVNIPTTALHATNPQDNTPGTTLTDIEPKHNSAQASINENGRGNMRDARRLRRPISIQVRNKAAADQPNLPPPPVEPRIAFELEGLTPPAEASPPKPTRKAPSPPSPPSHEQARRGTARVGREPPPVPSSATSPKPRISVSSRAESYFDSPAPHPFIPPIRVSERKFRGSLDGPWNVSYDGPQRTFLDLSA